MRYLLLLLLALSLVSCSDSSDTPKETNEEPLHVLFITLDTTRQDRVGVYGRRVGGESTTPAIDAVAKEGRVYERAFCSTPLTLPSHVTMLTGLEPPQHGVRENNDFQLVEKSGRDFSTVSEDLKDAGFATAAFVSARVLAGDFGLRSGFDIYDEVPGGTGTGLSHYEERDAVTTTSEALKWFDKMDQKRSFMWVHYFDPHHPYKKHLGRAELIAKAGDLYDGEIAYVDTQVARLVQAYKERGLWKNTLVVILGDHGEGLGEHGEESHGFLLHDATMRIPYIVKPSANLSLSKKRYLARTVDLKPTLLEAAGLKQSSVASGRSLTKAYEDEEAVSYGESVYPFRQFNWAALYSLRSENWLLIEGAGKSLLYNHLEDPSELRDLALKRPDQLKKMQRLLLAERRRLKSCLKEDSRRDPDGMRSNAYVGGPAADIPEEPTIDANKLLVHPRDRMGTLNQLNRLIRTLETLAHGRDESKKQQAFVDAEMISNRLRQVDPDSPAIRFWLGRAQWKIGASSLAKQLGPGMQSATLLKGVADLDRYIQTRALDFRAWNMRLSILLLLAELSKDAAHLKKFDSLVTAQIGRGLDDGLTHNLHARSFLMRNDKDKARAAFEKAVKKAPNNKSFLRDLQQMR